MIRVPFMKERTLDIATDRDVQKGVNNALQGLQMSLTDLRSQAKTGRFRTERARLVWSAIRDVAPND